jgi:hypothetical protein
MILTAFIISVLCQLAIALIALSGIKFYVKVEQEYEGETDEPIKDAAKLKTVTFCLLLVSITTTVILGFIL